MPDLVNLSDVIDGAEQAITAFEHACVALNDTNATDEVNQRSELERLVTLLQRLDVARESVAWSEDWV